jgi:hypothetical protein
MNHGARRGNTTRMPSRALLLSLLTLTALPALADDTPALHATHDLSPFDRTFGLGAYATGWHGAYGGYGVGGRVRLEPWRFLGVDLFGEALLVATPAGVRHDHPIGFHLYMPFRVTESVRLRPLLGMCVVASFIEPTEPNAPRADDVLVGAHVGGGVDVALHGRVSLFAEAKAVVWVGHDRSVQGWTGAVGNQVQPFVVGQAQVGLMVHLGER